MKVRQKYQIGLGSAQWGLDYGISNIYGKSKEEIKKIIAFSEKYKYN